MNARALKPCPFCGGSPSLETFMEEHVIFGDVPWLRVNCQCRVMEHQLVGHQEVDLVMAWNRRVPVAPPAGYALVPLQITAEMAVAFAESWFSRQRPIDDCDLQDAWEAALAVRPEMP